MGGPLPIRISVASDERSWHQDPEFAISYAKFYSQLSGYAEGSNLRALVNVSCEGTAPSQMPALQRAKQVYAEFREGEAALLQNRDWILGRAWELGRLLAELKHEVGRGNWQLWLESRWPDLENGKRANTWLFLKTINISLVQIADCANNSEPSPSVLGGQVRRGYWDEGGADKVLLRARKIRRVLPRSPSIAGSARGMISVEIGLI